MVAVNRSPSAPTGGAAPTLPDAVAAPARVITLALTMVAAQLVVRGWVSAGGFLYADDFVVQSRAARLPFPSSELLLTALDGRLSPGGMTVAWLTATVAPLSQVGVVVGLVLLQATASLAVLAMLLRVFGPRMLLLVPLVFYLVSPLTLPAFLWWAPALSSLPLQAGLAFAVWGHVGYLRTGRRLDLALSAAAVCVALAFSEKAVLIPFALFGATWILDRRPGLVGSWWSALRSHWRLWLSWSVVVAGFLSWYRSVVEPVTHASGTAGEWWRFAREGVVDAFWVPVMGGPVAWQPVGYANALSDPPAWLLVVSVVTGAAVVLGTSWASPRARRGWLLLLAFVVIDLATIVLVRGGGGITDLAPLTLRYTADAGVVASLVIGVCLMSPAGQPDPPRLRAARRRMARHPSASGMALFLAADVFLLFATISTVQLAAIWAANPAGQWVGNASRALVDGPPEEPVIPQPVPESVLSPLAFPENLTSYLLAPVAADGQFASQTSVLTTFDDAGTLVPAHVEGARALLPPDGSCWLAQGGRGLVPLDLQVPAGEYAVRLGTIAGSRQSGTVALGAGRPVRVVFERGLADLALVVTGAGARLYVTLDDVGPTVCVSQADVGTITPGPRTAP